MFSKFTALGVTNLVDQAKSGASELASDADKKLDG